MTDLACRETTNSIVLTSCDFYRAELDISDASLLWLFWFLLSANIFQIPSWENVRSHSDNAHMISQIGHISKHKSIKFYSRKTSLTMIGKKGGWKVYFRTVVEIDKKISHLHLGLFLAPAAALTCVTSLQSSHHSTLPSSPRLHSIYFSSPTTDSDNINRAPAPDCHVSGSGSPAQPWADRQLSGEKRGEGTIYFYLGLCVNSIIIIGDSRPPYLLPPYLNTRNAGPGKLTSIQCTMQF